jgi:Zinc finger, C3HC4 type (RING finger)
MTTIPELFSLVSPQHSDRDYDDDDDDDDDNPGQAIEVLHTSARKTIRTNDRLLRLENAKVVGNGNVIDGADCEVFGNGNTIRGWGCRVRGHNNRIEGDGHDVVGEDNVLNGAAPRRAPRPRSAKRPAGAAAKAAVAAPVPVLPTKFPVSVADTTASGTEIHCTVCADRKAAVVAYPCKHQTMCGQCCVTLEGTGHRDDSGRHTCPNCRQAVVEFFYPLT